MKFKLMFEYNLVKNYSRTIRFSIICKNNVIANGHYTRYIGAYDYLDNDYNYNIVNEEYAKYKDAIIDEVFDWFNIMNEENKEVFYSVVGFEIDEIKKEEKEND